MLCIEGWLHHLRALQRLGTGTQSEQMAETVLGTSWTVLPVGAENVASRTRSAFCFCRHSTTYMKPSLLSIRSPSSPDASQATWTGGLSSLEAKTPGALPISKAPHTSSPSPSSRQSDRSFLGLLPRFLLLPRLYLFIFSKFLSGPLFIPFPNKPIHSLDFNPHTEISQTCSPGSKLSLPLLQSSKNHSTPTHSNFLLFEPFLSKYPNPWNFA